MKRIAIINAKVVATMNEKKDELKDVNVIIEDGIIKSINSSAIKPTDCDKVVDATGCVLLPGFVNTHHHLYQSLTRNVPLMQNAELFPWLVNHYELWREIDNRAVYVSAKLALLELMQTGCTTSTDHLYLFPNKTDGLLIDEEIKAAKELGIRFQPTRGSMTLSKKDGGLPPDDVVQNKDDIQKDTLRLLAKYHNDSFGAMCRISLAPCSPFSVTGEQMKEVADFARDNNLMIHTHLAETIDEENFCLEKFGKQPAEYLDSLGWIANNSWTAHSIHLNDEEISKMGACKMGIAHCPSSNMRLGSGIARIREMLDAGVSVGLAVDGSASNDSSNMLAEARVALLLSRMRPQKKDWLTARDVLWMATKGGALALGRDDIGSIEVGKCADLALFDMNKVGYAGGLSDPLAALVFCQANSNVDTLIVNGKLVIEQGKMDLDLDEIVQEHNKIAASLIEKASKNTKIDFLSFE